MITSIINIGSGLDIDFIKHFPQVEKFILIDTLPRANPDSTNSFDSIKYNNNFFRNLVVKFNSIGFVLKDKKIIDTKYHNKILSLRQKIFYWFYSNLLPEYINPTVLYFLSNQSNQLVKYYISTNIMTNFVSELESDVRNCDGLVLNGYIPDSKILGYFDHPIKLFGYTNNNYISNDKHFDDNIISFMNKFPSKISKYIDEIYAVVKENGDKTYCNTLAQIEEIQLEFDNKKNKVK